MAYTSIQSEVWSRPMQTLVPRPAYDALLDAYAQTPEIKVLTGIRRCGKSSLISLFSQKLLANGIPPENVCHIKLDGYGIPLNADATWLMEATSRRLDQAQPNQIAYVLLDEVQEVPHWEDVVRRLRNRPNTQVTITGSNARVLSGELATLLAGRYIEIPVRPLSFSEYLAFAESARWPTESKDALFIDYLTWGGMPGLFSFARGDEESYERLLSGIFDTVILKDVLERSRVQDPDLLDRLVRFVFSTSGNLFSTKRVVDALAGSGRKVSQQTVDNYLRALKNALILEACEQVGISGKEVLRPLRKFYPADNGLRNLTIGFSRTRDIGFQLENVVYNELRRRGFDVNVGSLRSGEVDFVAFRREERLYIQVCQSVLDEGTYLRETAPLEAVENSFPKMVIVGDRWRVGTTDKGICITNIVDWLLERQTP